MSDFRFFHAADIHLDSPLRGLAVHESSAAERVRTAARDALDQLVGAAIDEQVAFLIIAGDLYDGDWRDYKTGLFFVDQMGRLNRSGIPVYLLHGNHDAQSQIAKRLELPENVHVFSASKPKTFHLETIDAALHGQSFRQRSVIENLVPGYPQPVSGAFNIGVLHTGLDGMGGHENYAPCSLDDLINKGYDYWALGHIHKAKVLHERPQIVFPGNLQGRHARETGDKGARLVTVADGEIADAVFVPCDVVRWAVVPVSVSGAGGMDEVAGRVRQALESAVADEADGRLLACRVILEGRTELYAKLLASEEQTLAEARAAALGLSGGSAWVEKVKIKTEPAAAEQPAAAREDAIGELLRMLKEAEDDEDLLERFQGKDGIGGLVRSLPYEAREEIEDGIMQAAVEGDYAALIAQAKPYLSALLTSPEETP